MPYPPNRIARMLLWPWLAYRKLLGVHPRPFLCHLHDPELLLWAQLLRLQGFRVVFDVHENFPAEILYKPYMSAPLRYLASWAYRLAEKVLASGVATVHVLEEIARNYRQPKTVVRNLPRLDPHVEPAGRGAPPRPRLVYCGVVAADRGPMTMIEAVRLLRHRGCDCELIFVGNVLDARLERRIRERINAADLTDRVRLIGPLPYARAMAEVAAGDIGLCLFEPSPNNETSLPNKILEYMRAGLPVVASDFRKWREYVTATGAGLQVDPTSAAQVADAVEWILQHPDDGRRMGCAGRRAVEEAYCWEREEDKLLDFYRSLGTGR